MVVLGSGVLPLGFVQHLLLARACMNARVWFKPCHIHGSAKIPTLQWLPRASFVITTPLDCNDEGFFMATLVMIFCVVKVI
jgi:hypothetical protein